MTKRKDPNKIKPRGGARPHASALDAEGADQFRLMYETHFMWDCCKWFGVSRSTGWAIVNRHGAYALKKKEE